MERSWCVLEAEGWVRPRELSLDVTMSREKGAPGSPAGSAPGSPASSSASVASEPPRPAPASSASSAVAAQYAADQECLTHLQQRSQEGALEGFADPRASPWPPTLLEPWRAAHHQHLPGELVGRLAAPSLGVLIGYCAATATVAGPQPRGAAPGSILLKAWARAKLHKEHGKGSHLLALRPCRLLGLWRGWLWTWGLAVQGVQRLGHAAASSLAPLVRAAARGLHLCLAELAARRPRADAKPSQAGGSTACAELGLGRGQGGGDTAGGRGMTAVLSPCLTETGAGDSSRCPPQPTPCCSVNCTPMEAANHSSASGNGAVETAAALAVMTAATLALSLGPALLVGQAGSSHCSRGGQAQRHKARRRGAAWQEGGRRLPPQREPAHRSTRT
ncbi:hypothetical protein QJQ45_006431 [Haematococcus lacustris]|nr:hypothetical protein QJQ45_006431 [Haematococcus lacustris]